jgi:hypothetical protein
MSEIRFATDELFEEKMSFIMKRLKLNTKKKVIEYLLNTKYESEMEKESKKP